MLSFQRTGRLTSLFRSATARRFPAAIRNQAAFLSTSLDEALELEPRESMEYDVVTVGAVITIHIEPTILYHDICL